MISFLLTVLTFLPLYLFAGVICGKQVLKREMLKGKDKKDAVWEAVPGTFFWPIYLLFGIPICIFEKTFDEIEAEEARKEFEAVEMRKLLKEHNIDY